MHRLISICGLATAMILAWSSGVAGPLAANVATIDLTPPMEMKAPLGGYGDRMSAPATGVHDRVYAKALVVSDGSKRFALVTADVLGFPPEFKPAVMAQLAAEGWTPDQVMLLPSHSHTSIEMLSIHPKNSVDLPQIGLFNQQVYELTARNLAEAIRRASQGLEPVVMATNQIELKGWNRNRRRGNSVVDPELTITRIDRADGRPLVALVNWTAHPTFMGADDMMFSGGWPGHMQRTLEALIGPGVTAMYYNGAEGDQSPTPRADSGGSWERAERYGRELGIIVWKAWQKIKPAEASALEFHRERIALPERKWHPDFMRTGGAEYGMSEENVNDLIHLLFPTETHSTTVRLGDLVIVGIPGEMAAALGESVKKQARKATEVQHVAIGGLADEWVSYILAPEEWEKGGYEASVSFYGAPLGPTIVEGAVRGAGRLMKWNRGPIFKSGGRER